MPVRTVESEAGTGEKSASILLSEVVVTAITLANPAVNNRAEASRIELYSGTSAEGIVTATLESGWTIGTHVLRWTGRLNLRGSYVLAGTINHTASVKHRLTVLTEPKEAMPRGMWDWPAIWGGSPAK